MANPYGTGQPINQEKISFSDVFFFFMKNWLIVVSSAVLLFAVQLGHQLFSGLSPDFSNTITLKSKQSLNSTNFEPSIISGGSVPLEISRDNILLIERDNILLIESVIEDIQSSLPSLLIEKYGSSINDVSVERINRDLLEVSFIVSYENYDLAEFTSMIDGVLLENVSEAEISLSKSLENSVRDLVNLELAIEYNREAQVEFLEKKLSLAQKLGVAKTELDHAIVGPAWIQEALTFRYGTQVLSALIEELKKDRSFSASIEQLIEIKLKQTEIRDKLASLSLLPNINSMDFFEVSIERQQKPKTVLIQPLVASILIGLMVGLLLALTRQLITNLRNA